MPVRPIRAEDYKFINLFRKQTRVCGDQQVLRPLASDAIDIDCSPLLVTRRAHTVALGHLRGHRVTKINEREHDSLSYEHFSTTPVIRKHTSKYALRNERSN